MLVCFLYPTSFVAVSSEKSLDIPALVASWVGAVVIQNDISVSSPITVDGRQFGTRMEEHLNAVRRLHKN